MELMRSNKVGCLPVVDDGQLVGIVTSYDFLDASARLFKEQLTATACAEARGKACSAGVGKSSVKPFCEVWRRPLSKFPQD
jgi:CBS-domain-containing membrane protein